MYLGFEKHEVFARALAKGVRQRIYDLCLNEKNVKSTFPKGSEFLSVDDVLRSTGFVGIVNYHQSFV